jgi:hypothetical protein
MKLHLPILAIWLTAGLSTACAVKTDHLIVDTYADFCKGISRSVSVSENGTLQAAPVVSKEAEVEPGQIWSAVPMPDGTVLLGTSPEGKLLRVERDGKNTLVHKFAETHLYAITRSPAGEVFVASSPDGKIYRVGAKGKPSVFFDPKEKYIWALLFDSKGVLYAATGTQGRIYRVTAENQGEVYYQSDETHMRSLAWDKDGNLLAGSADSGYLYRIKNKNEGVVLYATGRQEINRIAVSTSGTIYFSALGAAKTNSTGAGLGAASLSTPSLRSVSVSPPAPEGGKDSPGASASAPVVTALTALSLPKTSASHNSGLYKLDSSLFASQIWSGKDNIITLDLEKNTAYIGTSGEGYVFSVDERGQSTRLLKLEADNISASARLAGGALVYATSNPGRLYKIGAAKSAPGVYESEVIDASSFAKWGAVAVQGKGGIEIRTRSGNTPKPDKSWYPWQPLSGGVSQSPSARYFQIELSLYKEAQVDRLDAWYLPRNLPPKIEQVEITAPGLGFTAIPTPPAAPQAKSPDQILAAAAKNEPETPLKVPARFQPAESKPMRTAVWKATDPNNDELEYAVYYRREGTENWNLMAKELKDSVISWDSSGWPDGNYYLKVEASDANDNSLAEALKDELQSRMFTVDTVPPLIRVDSVRAGKVAFTVQKEVSRLAKVSVSATGREYKEIRPVDGILDSKTERFEKNLKPGEVLFIRAEDECGNVSGVLVQQK